MERWKTEYIAIHCSATPPSMDIGVDEIRQMHLKRGFKDIGYNRVIRRSGEWEQGRDDDAVGAHVEGYNSISIGVCLVGGVDAHNKAEDNFTIEQMDTLKQIVLELIEKYPNAIVQGHRDFPDVHKDCPCFDVTEWMQQEGL